MTTKLSPRQIEILRMMAEGLQNKQIARQLNTSVPTVGSHIRFIYLKLGVNARASAVMAGVRAGYFTDERPLRRVA